MKRVYDDQWPKPCQYGCGEVFHTAKSLGAHHGRHVRDHKTFGQKSRIQS